VLWGVGCTAVQVDGRVARRARTLHHPQPLHRVRQQRYGDRQPVRVRLCSARSHLAAELQGAGVRVQGSGFRVQGSGFRVSGSGFRVQGLGFSGFRIRRHLPDVARAQWVVDAPEAEG